MSQGWVEATANDSSSSLHFTVKLLFNILIDCFVLPGNSQILD